MQFRHHPQLRADFPTLVAGTIRVDGVSPDPVVDVAPWLATARERLAGAAESQLPPIQAWRRAFAAMGLKPTQYRCASESLLRRLRREGDLPSLHPLVDLCNAVSAAYAVPVAALDADRISGDLEVRRAAGTERYDTFAGDVEHPEPGEVVFADDAGRAHARRWTNRQSGHSAISAATTRAFIVTEALHEGAAADVPGLLADLAAALRATWPAAVVRVEVPAPAQGSLGAAAASGR
ncbi:phenylalanine--tRNA ligase beta subunit-related protein [Dactylosporangium sp. NBC_01737]|uniref:B3/B4 domain-containing protein n=1 Tax=Dactylosporangium sp. NBC_01737 TaxID=2975959 RepID=UPI002E12A830|nr:phenylalanine--tRNA ligase beta subunit-related protein [Dactylosporangium sp. NBC_01737]